MALFLLLFISLVVVLIIYFVSFRYLIRIVGEYAGYEINSLSKLFLFAINPLNYFKLYKIFFGIQKGEYDFDRNKYRKILIANILSYVSFLVLAILISNYTEVP